MRDEDIIELHDASLKEVKNTFYMKLNKLLREEPNTNILFFHVYAGHGVQYDGMQCLLVNEYSNNFYYRYQAENLIRMLSRNKNSYHVALFACCREKQKAKYEFLSLE